MVRLSNHDLSCHNWCAREQEYKVLNADDKADWSKVQWFNCNKEGTKGLHDSEAGKGQNQKSSPKKAKVYKKQNAEIQSPINGQKVKTGSSTGLG